MLGARRKESQTRTNAAASQSEKPQNGRAGSRGRAHPCQPTTDRKTNNLDIYRACRHKLLTCRTGKKITTTNRRQAASLARLHSPASKSPCLLLPFLLVHALHKKPKAVVTPPQQKQGRVSKTRRDQSD